MMFSLAKLAEHVGASVHGDANCSIFGIATLEQAQPGQISFLSNALYKKYLANTQASAVILAAEDLAQCNVNALVSDNPYLCYAKVARIFDNAPIPQAGQHATAVIAATATVHPSASIAANVVIEDGAVIEADVIIGSGCVVGRGVKIGKSSRLWANVTLYHDVIIGERAIIHSGVVIGSDGFGLAFAKGAWYKIAQLGKVVIGNDVEIGANSTIDRGAVADTIIEDDVKLDNQVQIAHNVHIGAHTAIAGCTGISGSTKIGKYCRIGGASGIAGHLIIADQVVITGMSMVTASIKQAGVYSSGTGLLESRVWQKNAVRFRHLDEYARQLKALEQRITELESSAK